MITDSRPIRVLQVFTVDQSLIFVTGQTEYMARNGVEVSLAAADGPNAQRLRARGVTVHAVPFTRSFTARADLRAFHELIRIIRSTRPDIVHGSTPKAGLLSMLAATAAGVRSRIYHMRGLPHLSERGLRAVVLRSAERVACSAALRVICVSRSLRDHAVAEGLVPAEKVAVLGEGSGNGVDCFGRFDPARVPAATVAGLRARLGIPAGAFVFGFIGRFARAKGVEELAEAWRALLPRLPAAHLVLVGEDDARDPASGMDQLSALPRVHRVAPTERIQEWHAVFDALVLPTWREGLSNVLLEAGAMGKPAIASRVVGCVDVIVDCETGLLVPPRDPGALADAMAGYVADPLLARQHGAAARDRITRLFTPRNVWQPLLEQYREMAGMESEAAPA